MTAAALTSKLWLVRPDASGQWQAKEVATIGDPAKIPLPVDISIRRGRQGALGEHVHGRHDALLRPLEPGGAEADLREAHRRQVNMISQSWDGTRVYITSSLLANWDKAGADNEQFLRGFSWDGKELKPTFEVDFTKEKLGRAHHMKLGSKVLRTRVRGAGRRSPAADADPARHDDPRRRGDGCGSPRRRTAPTSDPAASTSSCPSRERTSSSASCARPDGTVLTVDGRLDKLSPLHARPDHPPRLHLHELHRSAGLSDGLSRLRPPEGRDPGHAVARGTRCSFVTLSFDPARDTPSVMKRYAGQPGRRRRRAALVFS